MATFRVDVDGKKVGRQIKRRIEDGVDGATDEIARGVERVAKGKIRREDAVWRHHLLEGFEDATLEFGDRTVVSVTNVSDHAPAQEHGVSGTQVFRNTPYRYKNKKPPLDALIPWILDNLYGAFWPDDLGDAPDGYFDSDDGGSSGSSGTSGSGGSGGSGGTGVDDGDDGIPTDDNGLYAGEAGYITHDMNDEFSNRWMFPGQKIVVYDTYFKRYNRGTVLDFPESDDDQLKFELDRVGGGVFTIETGNQDEHRIVGYEDFDQVPESDLQQRLRDHFDANIRGAEDEEVLQGAFAKKQGLIKPDPDRMDWLRDKWTTEIWDLYDDKWLVKEQLRNLEAIVDYEDAKVKKGYAGGIGPYNDSSRFIGVFLSKTKIQKFQGATEAEYLDTLKHEVAHALSASNFFGHPGVKAYGQHVKDFAKFDRDGNELTGATASPSGDPIQLPKDAKLQMFHDEAAANGGVVGGTDWMGDAYDAAKQGTSGIESYTPTFEHGPDEPLSRLHEAANKAYWLQVVESTERGGNVGKYDPVFVQRAYSITNAEETLATLNEVLSSIEEDYEKRIRRLHELYPWLIEAWLEVYNPPTNVADILRDLGYNV